MFNNNDGFTMPVMPAYYGYGNNGMFGFGDNGIWTLILFAVLFGWGGNGIGIGGRAGEQYATVGDVERGFNTQTIIGKLDGINNGICSLGYDQLAQMNGINQNISTTGFAIQQAINADTISNMQNTNALATQLADCCCTTQRGIDGINYNIATSTCAIQNTMNNNTRDIIESQNAGTRAILDYLCQDKISTLQAENQSLKFAASQQAQNAFITANQEAQTAELIRRLGADCPQPAYVVQPPKPVTFPTNCCGTFFGFNGCGNGCGC